MKLKADKRIRANPMPLRAPALAFEKIKAVEAWITKLVNIATMKAAAAALGAAAPAPADAAPPAAEAPPPDAKAAPGSGGTANP